MMGVMGKLLPWGMLSTAMVGFACSSWKAAAINYSAWWLMANVTNQIVIAIKEDKQ